MMKTMDAISLVRAERWRQDELRAEGRFSHTLADDGLTDPERFVVLSRELGELAQSIQAAPGDSAPARHGHTTRDELVQIAALAVAWLERFEL